MNSTEALTNEHKRKYVNTKINGKPVSFQLDTGSDLIILKE